MLSNVYIDFIDLYIDLILMFVNSQKGNITICMQDILLLSNE